MGFCSKLIVSQKGTYWKRTKLIERKKNKVRSRKNFETKVIITCRITKKASIKLRKKEKHWAAKINRKSWNGKKAKIIISWKTQKINWKG